MELPLFDGRPFRYSDALSKGMTPKRLRWLCRQGGVRRLLVGVYVDAKTPDDLALRAEALSLVRKPETVACRATAAWLLGLPVQRLGSYLEVPPIEVCSPAASAAVRRAGARGFTAELSADDIVVIGDLAVTTPRRTALDLARWCDRWDGLAYLDAMLRAGLVAVPELEDALAAMAGLPWVEQARELVSYADPGAESPMESFMRLRYLDAGFPRPETQVPIEDQLGVVRYRLDCGVRARLFGFEYDGEEFHGDEQSVPDERRRKWIEDQGWRVEPFRKYVLLARTPEFEWIVGNALGVDPCILTYEERRRTRLRDKRRRAPAA
jgi:very-short-patch-repair endonuclease